MYYYGLMANLIQSVGTFVCFGIGFLFILLGIFYNPLFFIATPISMVVGGMIILSGKAQRFDFQRQSGSIIHRGDW